MFRTLRKQKPQLHVLSMRFPPPEELVLCFRFLTRKTKISLLVSINASKTRTVKQIKGTTQVSWYLSMAPNFTAASVIGKILISSCQHRRSKSPTTYIPYYFCKHYFCSPYTERVIASLWSCLYGLCKIKTGSLMGLVKD